MENRISQAWIERDVSLCRMGTANRGSETLGEVGELASLTHTTETGTGRPGRGKTIPERGQKEGEWVERG